MPHIEVNAGANLTSSQVETANIKNGSITEEKLAGEAVGEEKTKRTNVPVPPAAENTQEAGSGGIPRKITFAYTGNGAETKVKIAHQRKNFGCVAFALKSSAKKPTELPTTPLGKWVNETENEGTYTFTAAPAAKEEVFIIIIG